MTSDFVKKCRNFLAGLGYHSLLPSAGCQPDQLVSPLLQIISAEGNEQLLEEAAFYLGLLGAAAEPAVAPLVAIIRANPTTLTAEEIQFGVATGLPWTYSTATSASMDALKLISPEKGIQAIGALCRDSDPQVRYRAVLTIRRIGEPSNRAIPDLVELLRDVESKIRQAALLGLWLYQPLDDQAASAVATLLGDSDPIARIRADYLLASRVSNFLRHHPNALSELIAMLRAAAEGQMPMDAVDTVCMMGRDAPRFVDSVVQLLRSNIPITIPAVAAFAFALREIARRDPSLKRRIHSSLKKLALPSNRGARFVHAAFEAELSRLGIDF